MKRTTVGKIFAVIFPLITYLIFGQRVRGLILFGLWVTSILLQQYVPFVVLATLGIAIYTRYDAWQLVKQREKPKQSFQNTCVDLGSGDGKIVDLGKKEPNSHSE